MVVLLTVLSIILAIGFGGSGVRKLTGGDAQRAAAAHFGLGAGAWRAIACAELAAAVGLVAGIFVPVMTVLAASGLVVLMLGAVISHVRAGDRFVSSVPAVVLGSGSIAAVLVGSYVL